VAELESERVRHEDKLGKVAMRIIGGAIVIAFVVVIAEDGVNGFPYGWWGLIGAVILAAVSFAVAQVE
jgi:hypothetical protein